MFTSSLVAVVCALGLGSCSSSSITEKNTQQHIQNVHTTPYISVSPSKIVQGDPFLISVLGTSSVAVQSISYKGKIIDIFDYKGFARGIIGVDLRATTGNFPITIKLKSGDVLSQTVTIAARPRIKAPLGIPEKFGGNTEVAAQKLVTTLNEEARVLTGIVSTSTRMWRDSFRMPLQKIFITDTYGYSRQTMSAEIAHKGTDFRATEGTSVYAMNDGVVVIARNFVAYGNLIAIDHGQGIVTLYLHLSKSNVKIGDSVHRGDVIGLSGSTGYAEGAHLHISVKVRGISIDPETFMRLLGEK